MKVLDTRVVRLKDINESEEPYAILSHTWGRDEVLFEDMTAMNGYGAQKLGYAKVRTACAKALGDGYKSIWIDTCCIDKKSSAELSEAINSMFRWYKKAKVCYALLSDVSTIEDIDKAKEKSEFWRSRWFTRGWTLQELLAPRKLEFFSSSWEYIGSKISLASYISKVTLINIEYLHGEDLRSASVAQRMSWASRRTTTRTEDIAYCLLGIFDINMPLLYGEGDRAFRRLQDEILRTSNDESIFASHFAKTRGICVMVENFSW
ncbi:heterokaryon incompatibility protein-domain-containing protein [Bisporella sp. PMI_857]|nr:heterokaryon incompatibility protein-domain-containing protein [Bisporella sp. PMI_857]